MKLLIVSNMYPNNKFPSRGIFVKRFTEELDKLGISYKKSFMYGSSNFLTKFFRYLLFYISTFIRILFGSFDIVYVHYASHSSLPVLKAAKLKKFRIFTNVHGSDVVPDNIKQEKFQKYTKQILRISEKIIVPSEYFMNLVKEKYKLGDKRFEIYPSAGINTDIFYDYDDEKKEEIFKQLAIDKNKKTISYIGRLISGKGWRTYLNAINILNKKGIDANYIFVGDGPELEQYNELVCILELKNIIKFPLLPQEKLAEIYNISDAFIFPTEREGESLGLVALEAMACGAPVIASDFAAPKYYVKNDYNGYKFAVGSPVELAEKITEFYNLDKDKLNLLKAGAITTSEYFSSKNLSAALEKIFSDNINE